jgi:hypothetical protein
MPEICHTRISHRIQQLRLLLRTSAKMKHAEDRKRAKVNLALETGKFFVCGIPCDALNFTREINFPPHSLTV